MTEQNPTAQERADRLERANSQFRADQPDVARALDVLGLSVEEFEHGLAGYSSGPQVHVSTSTRPLDDEVHRRPA